MLNPAGKAMFHNIVLLPLWLKQNTETSLMFRISVAEGAVVDPAGRPHGR